MNDYVGMKVIASIEFTDPIDEVNITTPLKKWGKCDLIVWPDEGTIPHFHVKSTTTGKEACVCIFEPKYFNHKEYHTTMGKKEREELDAFLKKKPSPKKDETYWDVLKAAWVQNNKNKFYEHKDELKEMQQPDYSKMTEDRHK